MLTRVTVRRGPMPVCVAVIVLILLLVILVVAHVDRRRVPSVLTYTVTRVPTLGGKNAQPLSINDRNQVVGHSNTVTGADHAFLWDEETGIIDLGVLGGRSSCAQAVNDTQQVTGWSHDPNENDHAFFWDPHLGMIDLGTLGGNSSRGEDINKAGQVVGWAGVDRLSKSLIHAFLWENRQGMIDLGTLGGKSSKARAINDHSQVVGIADTNDLKKHAFLWHESTGMVDLTLRGVPGVANEALDINNHGQVLGTFDTASGQEQIFFWDPNRGVITHALPMDGSVHRLKFNDVGQIVLILWHWERRFLWLRLSDTYVTSHLLTWNGEEITHCRRLPRDARLHGFWGINNLGQIAGDTREHGPVVLTFDESESWNP